MSGMLGLCLPPLSTYLRPRQDGTPSCGNLFAKPRPGDTFSAFAPFHGLDPRCILFPSRDLVKEGRRSDRSPFELHPRLNFGDLLLSRSQVFQYLSRYGGAY